MYVAYYLIPYRGAHCGLCDLWYSKHIVLSDKLTLSECAWLIPGTYKED